MLELTIILDSNARNPFFCSLLFFMFGHFSRKRDEWSEREGGTRSHWATLRNWNWTLRGLCGYLVCLTDAAVPALFPLPEHTTHCREEQHNSTHKHAHTHTREKRKLTKAMRMLLLMTHTAVVLSLSLSVSLLLCCVLPNWKLARDDEDTDSTHSLATPRSAFALRECLHISNWYATPHAHARMISSSGRAKRNNNTHKMKLRLHTE